MSMTNNDTSVLGANTPGYFRSFASYEIPFRPDEPIDFVDTEGLRSFYAAYRDAAGRLIRFDKVRLVRAENAPRPFALAAGEPPGATLYFKARRDPATLVPRPGEQLDYKQTEPLNEFFVAQVDSTGRNCQATLFPEGNRLLGRLRILAQQPSAEADHDQPGQATIGDPLRPRRATDRQGG